ncbi:MAG: TIGR02757 family protein [Proteobacteria bacterium]|nr:TIGR02757 family protein [Pseudomonadota bacterium]
MLLGAFDARYLQSDPLCFVHRYSKREDQEVVGIIASSLAYGKVAGIKRSVERVLAIMGAHPASFAARFSPATHAPLFDGFVHRFNRGVDVACLIYFIRQMMEESGSIGEYFLKGYNTDDSRGDGGTGTGSPVKRALDTFTRSVLSLESAPVYGQKRLGKHAGVRYFFPAPSNGSACKRLNLYLRWMVRPADGLDLGLWTGVDPADLIIPIDTHLGRISQNLGLTTRKSADWKCAEEVTARLARLDPKDPLKYDFALCRLGILDRCPKRVDPVKCAECIIREICVL